MDPNIPPYNWMPAYGLFEKEYKIERKKLIKMIHPHYPLYIENQFKLIRIISEPWDCIFSTILIYGMCWDDVKKNILIHLMTIKDNRKDKIDIRTIEDIGLSYTPLNNFTKFGSIDYPQSDPFTMIYDNSMLFIHQVKRQGVWLFHN